MIAKLSPRRNLRRIDQGDRWLLAALVVAVVPVVVATVHALTDGWITVGDNGYFLLRSRDVLTEHTPLLGTWTSSSTALSFDVNNPGPMLFFLLALPVKVGESGGLAVGVAMLNVASILGIAYALRRSAGPLVAILGLVAVTGLGWSMGGPLLFDPWQPHSLLHPFLLFLVLAWVTAAGNRWALPWVAGVASLLVQTHLSYVYVVPAAGAVGVAGLISSTIRARRHHQQQWPETRAGLRRVGIGTAAVVAVCWLPSLVEQITGSGRGNLSRLLDASRAGAPSVGAADGIGRSAEVLALWPTWLRPSFGEVERFGDLADPVGWPVATLALAVLSVVLAGAGWWAWRRHDRFAFAGIVVTGIAGIAGVYTATAVIDTTLGVASHHLRYLWPVAITAQLAVVVAVVRGLHLGARRPALMVSTAAVVVLAIANVPQVARSVGPAFNLDAAPAVRAMNEQLHALEGRGTMLVTFESRPFAEPFSAPLLAELGRRGIDFVVDEDVEAHQVGRGRSYDGDADARVFLRWGTAALDDQPDARRVALASVLDADEIETWLRIRDEIEDAIESGAVELTDDGRAAAARGDLALTTEDGRIDLEMLRFLVMTAPLQDAVAEGWISIRGMAASDVDAWLALEPLLPTNTVSVWVSDEPESRA